MIREPRHMSVIQALDWVHNNTLDLVFMTVHDDEDVVYTRICETGSCVGETTTVIFTLRQDRDYDYWFWARTRQVYGH